jgi:hypothetical protein
LNKAKESILPAHEFDERVGSQTKDGGNKQQDKVIADG